MHNLNSVHQLSACTWIYPEQGWDRGSQNVSSRSVATAPGKCRRTRPRKEQFSSKRHQASMTSMHLGKAKSVPLSDWCRIMVFDSLQIFTWRFPLPVPWRGPVPGFQASDTSALRRLAGRSPRPGPAKSYRSEDHGAGSGSGEEVDK